MESRIWSLVLLVKAEVALNRKRLLLDLGLEFDLGLLFDLRQTRAS